MKSGGNRVNGRRMEQVSVGHLQIAVIVTDAPVRVETRKSLHSGEIFLGLLRGASKRGGTKQTIYYPATNTSRENTVRSPLFYVGTPTNRRSFNVKHTHV